MYGGWLNTNTFLSVDVRVSQSRTRISEPDTTDIREGGLPRESVEKNFQFDW